MPIESLVESGNLFVTNHRLNILDKPSEEYNKLSEQNTQEYRIEPLPNFQSNHTFTEKIKIENVLNVIKKAVYIAFQLEKKSINEIVKDNIEEVDIISVLEDEKKKLNDQATANYNIDRINVTQQCQKHF